VAHGVVLVWRPVRVDPARNTAEPVVVVVDRRQVVPIGHPGEGLRLVRNLYLSSGLSRCHCSGSPETSSA